MIKRLLLLAVPLLVCAGVVHAHTHLKASMPSDKAVLGSPPSAVMLHFSGPTRLTALSIQKEGDTESKDVKPLPKNTSPDLNIPLSPLAPGKYLMTWRAVGGDNHVMSGKLQFTVQGK